MAQRIAAFLILFFPSLFSLAAGTEARNAEIQDYLKCYIPVRELRENKSDRADQSTKELVALRVTRSGKPGFAIYSGNAVFFAPLPAQPSEVKKYTSFQDAIYRLVLTLPNRPAKQVFLTYIHSSGRDFGGMPFDRTLVELSGSAAGKKFDQVSVSDDLSDVTRTALSNQILEGLRDMNYAYWQQIGIVEYREKQAKEANRPFDRSLELKKLKEKFLAMFNGCKLKHDSLVRKLAISEQEKLVRLDPNSLVDVEIEYNIKLKNAGSAK